MGKYWAKRWGTGMTSDYDQAMASVTEGPFETWQQARDELHAMIVREGMSQYNNEYTRARVFAAQFDLFELEERLSGEALEAVYRASKGGVGFGVYGRK